MVKCVGTNTTAAALAFALPVAVWTSNGWPDSRAAAVLGEASGLSTPVVTGVVEDGGVTGSLVASGAFGAGCVTGRPAFGAGDVIGRPACRIGDVIGRPAFGVGDVIGRPAFEVGDVLGRPAFAVGDVIGRPAFAVDGTSDCAVNDGSVAVTPFVGGVVQREAAFGPAPV